MEGSTLFILLLKYILLQKRSSLFKFVLLSAFYTVKHQISSEV
jgi:hypothetical protein